MSPTDGTKVLIGGKVYTLAGNESEEYIQRVALYINNKLEEMNETENAQKLNTRLQSVLVQINIADDFFKEKSKNQELENRLHEKQDTIEELYHVIKEHDQHILAVKEEEKKDKEALQNKIIDLEKQLEVCRADLNEYIEVFDQGKA